MGKNAFIGNAGHWGFTEKQMQNLGVPKAPVPEETDRMRANISRHLLGGPIIKDSKPKTTVIKGFVKE